MSLPPVESIYFTVDSIKELKNANLDFKFSSPALVSRFLYELCWTMVRGDLPFQKCKVVLEAVEFSDCGPEGDIGSYFADVVTQMAQDVKWLVESALVPVRFFQEHCEGEFLWESEMTKIKAADLKSKEVRVNTRLLYQQTKFNLLQEESEGYAKLVTLLCQVPEASSKSASTATVGIIKVLECFELQPDKIVFLDLIPMFRKSHALQILGFKVQYHQRMEVTSPVPIGLYELAALLLKKDFIDVDSILNVDAPGWMMEEMEGDAISLWEPLKFQGFNKQAFERKLSLEDILGTFISETRSRFNKDESRLDNIETHMTNMGATVKNLEVQLGQIATAIQSQQKGKFSSDTEVNLREHCNAITLRSGKVVEESKPKEVVMPTPDPILVDEKLVEEQKVETEATKETHKPYTISFPDN